MKLTKARKPDPPKKTIGRVKLFSEPPQEAPALGVTSILSFKRTPVESGVFNDDGNKDGTSVRGESH